MQGKIVTTTLNHKWVVYDQSDDGSELYCVTFPNLEGNAVIQLNAVIQIEDQPKNVSWLFMKRRKNNLKGLEKYV